MPWRKVQTIAFWLLVPGGLLAVGAAAGLLPMPKGPPALAWKVHPIVIALGLGCGLASVARMREIDRARWRVLEDASITSGERDWAHREAESEIRGAGTVFVLCGVAWGAFGAYQLRDPGTLGAADFLMVSPLFGFAAGLLVGVKVFPPVPRGG